MYSGDMCFGIGSSSLNIVKLIAPFIMSKHVCPRVCVNMLYLFKFFLFFLANKVIASFIASSGCIKSSIILSPRVHLI
uniref:Uncharacterized protein n=1 Tax=viral metagenome TaxID=1070528 RepID=A0A6C0J4C1_9ZZZZ